jgi:hypothetical protein
MNRAPGGCGEASKISSTGVLVTRYVREGEVQPGSFA